MSAIEKAINYSKKIESLLSEELNASGKGLHEKVTSVESVLDDKLVKQVRWIATMRNKVVHESDFEITDIEHFEKSCNNTIALLKDAITAIKIERIEKVRREKEKSQQIKSSPVNHSPVNEKEGESSSSTTKGLLIFSLIINAFFIYFLNQLSTNADDLKADLRKSNSKYYSYKKDLDKKKDEFNKLSKSNLKALQALTKINKDLENKISQLKQDKAKSSNRSTTSANKVKAKEKTHKKVSPKSNVSLKKGSLLELANKSKNDFQNAKNEIDYYFNDLAKNLKVTISNPDMRAAKSGRVDLIYRAYWRINKSRLDKLVDKHLFKGYTNKKSGHLKISKYSLKDAKNSYAKELFTYLAKKKLSIKLTAGKYSKTLLIASGVSCHISCSVRDNTEKSGAYIIHYQGSEKVLQREDSNPIEIKDIPESYLENITDIKIEVINH